MIIYLCMKYESNLPMYSKDIARKPFFVRMGRDVRTYVRMNEGDAICPPPLRMAGHKKSADDSKCMQNDTAYKELNNTYKDPYMIGNTQWLTLGPDISVL